MDEPPQSANASSALSDLERKLQALESDLETTRAEASAAATESDPPTPPEAAMPTTLEPTFTPPAPPTAATPSSESAPAGPGMRSAREMAEALAESLTSQIERLFASAERAAEQTRRQAEAESDREAAQARFAAEQEAVRIRREAEAQAADYLHRVEAQIGQFAQDRIQRLSQIADELTREGERVLGQMHETSAVRQQLDRLINALGEASEEATREASRGGVTLPRIDAPPS